MEEEAVGIDDNGVVPGFVRGTRDEGLNEINAEEAKEVDEGGDEGDDGGEFGER